MKNLVLLILFIFSTTAFAQPSMRRCTLMPVTDSVGGAIGYKVFEEIEDALKKSNWCTYVSNSGLMSIFSKYRENLPQYLKTKEVISTVSEKLKVGSLLIVTLKNELNGIDIQLDVYGSDGEDLYFTEKTLHKSDEVEEISQIIKNWIDLYAKMIPYDAKINGVLGDQLTMDVGKGYPINVGQNFVVKRVVKKQKHPLLKKIVDWETEVLAEGKVFNLSENQALGMVTSYKTDKKLLAGDWIRLQEFKHPEYKLPEADKEKEEPGTLGVLSLALFASASSVDSNGPNGSSRFSGNLFGVDFRVEAWITRQYIAALELESSLGNLRKKDGNADKSSINANNGRFKLTGGYRYLPIGFFYGPQIDIYAGYANHSYNLDLSENDGLGQNSISGIMLGTAVNIPLNREYRLFARGEFIPFPSFKDEDNIFGTAKSVSALQLEAGIKYQFTNRTSLDGSVETVSTKAKFNGALKEVSYKDNRLKFGVSFNF